MIPDFSESDVLMQRLDEAVQELDNAFYKTRFIGFVSVAAVTAFEVNVREKVIDFSKKKHNVLETSQRQFSRRQMPGSNLRCFDLII